MQGKGAADSLVPLTEEQTNDLTAPPPEQQLDVPKSQLLDVPQKVMAGWVVPQAQQRELDTELEHTRAGLEHTRNDLEAAEATVSSLISSLAHHTEREAQMNIEYAQALVGCEARIREECTKQLQKEMDVARESHSQAQAKRAQEYESAMNEQVAIQKQLTRELETVKKALLTNANESELESKELEAIIRDLVQVRTHAHMSIKNVRVFQCPQTAYV